MTAPAGPPAALGARELDARAYTAAQCDALFAAVQVDDAVDARTRLPDAIPLDFAQEQLLACFGLSRRMWKTGFDHDVLIRLAATLWRGGELDAEDRLRFKHIRAKFKHFRYAHALYGAAHRYPPLLDRVTITMGRLQDAYRNGRRAATRREAALLRLLLSRMSRYRLHREADRLAPATPASFRGLLAEDFAVLAALLARDMVTGHQFHAARKVIGRQVSFWNALGTLQPAADRYDMSRSLSAINGLMGALHDMMIERKGEDPATYRASFALPEPIRERLAALVARYRESCPAA